MYQHLKSRREITLLASATPIGLKRPEIRRIAVLHSNSPVVKVDPPFGAFFLSVISLIVLPTLPWPLSAVLLIRPLLS